MAELKEYKSNSNKSKQLPGPVEPEKKIEKLNIGSVKTKKKSGLAKFKDSVVQEDAHNVGSYIFGEVLIPAFKNTISDMVRNATDMFLFGETRGSSSHRRSPGSKISYSSYYDDDGRRWKDRVKEGRYREESYDYDELTFETRNDANEVLDSMFGILHHYKVVTVADLYDLVGVPGRYTDNKWGWTDLRGAYVRRAGREFSIELPRPLPID